MGTRADFYINRGEKAEWLGSIAWDGHPDGDSEDLLNIKTRAEFVLRLQKLSKRDDWTSPEQGWPWPWKDSNTTDYSYAFDTKNRRVYITCFGYSWLTAKQYTDLQLAHQTGDELWAMWDKNGRKGPEPVVPPGPWESEDTKSCVFPDMTDVQNVTMGKRSGVMVFR